MGSAGVNSGSRSVTERIDGICGAVIALKSMRRTLPCNEWEDNGTQALESYRHQTLIDIAGLVGKLVKLTRSCRSNFYDAICKVSGECLTAISLIETCLLSSSPSSSAEAHKDVLLKILQSFPESFSQSVKILQANTALYKEAGKIVRDSTTRLYRIIAAAVGFCFAGILYSCYLQSAHTLGGVIPSGVTLSGVTIGYAYGITKVYPLWAALNETAQKFDQAIGDIQRVEDLINENIHLVSDSLSTFETMPTDIWADAATNDCLWQSINKLMEVCNEFVQEQEAEEDV